MAARHAMAHSSIMMRTDVLRQVGGYWSLPYGEEYDLMLRIGEVAELANLDRVLLHYRVHQASMNGSGMRRMRVSVAYACELARRRQNGLPEISFDEYQAWRDARPSWQRAAEAIDLHARGQYRLALGRAYGGLRLRGSARMGWAAICAPQLTLERLARVTKFRIETQSTNSPTTIPTSKLRQFSERSSRMIDRVLTTLSASVSMPWTTKRRWPRSSAPRAAANRWRWQPSPCMG